MSVNNKIKCFDNKYFIGTKEIKTGDLLGVTTPDGDYLHNTQVFITDAGIYSFADFYGNWAVIELEGMEAKIISKNSEFPVSDGEFSRLAWQGIGAKKEYMLDGKFLSNKDIVDIELDTGIVIYRLPVSITCSIKDDVLTGIDIDIDASVIVSGKTVYLFGEMVRFSK
jgi:hypothetical protein